MKTLRQLFRQSLKTVVGIVLMTLAASILCVCVGQALAAGETKEALNQRFSTVAIPLVQENSKGYVSASGLTVEAELLAWLEDMAENHPDIIKTVARHGMLSAYIPQMTPFNVTTEKYIAENITSRDHYEYYQFQSDPYAMPYSCAMLVITLDEVSKPTKRSVSYAVDTDLNSEDFESKREYQAWLEENPDTEFVTVDNYYQVELVGTVTDVVSLADGYRNPVGRFARLTYTATTLEEIEALNLVPGEQYIVYGINYFDEYWALMGELNYDGKYNHIKFEPFDPDLFEEYPDHTKESASRILGYEVFGHYNFIRLSERQYKMVNAISMDLSLPVHFQAYEDIRDENGKLLELKPVTTISIPGANGETITIPAEEYNGLYQIPTITKLEGGVADFLRSNAGQQWQTAMNRDAINNHSFAVIGVDKLSYLANVSLEKTLIAAGRDFTKEELEAGTRVCLIQESVAEASGLSVGDTIILNFYNADTSLPYQSFSQDGKGILNPSAAFYFDTTPIAETAEYTIVGLWCDEGPWPDVAKNEYAFSANTVFIPKSSTQTVMEESNSVLFVMPVLQNGKINEFHDLAMNSGFAGRFKYNDQGYSKIAGNFLNYEQLARQVLIVGIVIYMILLLLFLLLYPASQKNAVKTMASLGACGGRRFIYVLLSSMAICVPASILGGLTGTLLWKYVVSAMQAMAETSIALQLDPTVMVILATVQLVLALLLNIAVALFMVAPRGMSSRK